MHISIIISKIMIKHVRSTGEVQYSPFFSPVCLCVCNMVYIWFEGGVGAVSLAAVSVEGERGGLQDPVCQQPALPGGSASLADVQKHPSTPLYSPFPFLVYLPLLSLSTENTEAL